MNASTTCTLSGPVDFQGNTPSSTLDAFNFSTMSCATDYASTTETVGGFTRGELVNGYFLLAILVVIAYGFFYLWLRGVKIDQ